MSRISGDLVVRILEAEGLRVGAEPDEIVEFARRGNGKVVATLLSAWRAEGRPLTPEWQHRLDLHERRIATYERLDERIRALAPVVGLRGLRVAALYPRGLVRHMGDLDYLCADPATVWTVAQRLAAEDWEVFTVALLRAEGEVCPVIRLQRPPPDPVLAPEAVELTAVGLLGDLWSLPTRRLLDLPGLGTAAGDLVLLASEGTERGFCARDVVDGTLLLGALGEDDVTLVREGLVRYELQRPWARLARRLRSLDLVPPSSGSLMETRERPRAALRRAGRVARRLARPNLAALAYAQRAMMLERERPLGALVRRWSHRLAAADRVLAAGLPLFGLRVGDEVAPADALRFSPSGPVLTASTPLGRFAFVPADRIREEWLEGPG